MRITARSPILFVGWWSASCLITAPGFGSPLNPGATLCLVGVETPVTKHAAHERHTVLEQRISAALSAASFQVRNSETVSKLVERVQQESGGFFDPVTGRRDPERFHAFRRRLAQALRTEMGCDGQLLVRVVLVRAPFLNGVARWDGKEERVSSPGRILLNVLAGRSESGWVAALSLWLFVYDLEGQDVAFRSAGIESLVSLAAFRGADMLPEDLWLTNEESLDGAIQSALGPGGSKLRHQGNSW